MVACVATTIAVMVLVVVAAAIAGQSMGPWALVAVNPPEKKLDGIRDERGRGQGICVMGGSALPPPRPNPKLTWRFALGDHPRQHWKGGRGLASLPGRLSDFKMTPAWRHDLMMTPCVPAFQSRLQGDPKMVPRRSHESKRARI